MSNVARVVVGMSGGVDSSVAAYLLREAGHEVFGVMLRLWAEDAADGENRCCALDGAEAARRVCDRLGVPFYVIRATQPFYDQVVSPYARAFGEGLTPNPCIHCNRSVRFPELLRIADVLGAEQVATGHYARVLWQGSEPRLFRGTDPLKDQAYALHRLSRQCLARAVFPLGDLNKVRVREIAAAAQLPTATRRDSFDLCFVADDYRGFLQRNHPELLQPGPIRREDGAIVGEHAGVALVTIGQRSGISGQAAPLYVTRVDPATAEVWVGPRQALFHPQILVDQLQWIGEPPPDGSFLDVQLRYRAPAVRARLTALESGDRVQVRFDEPQRAPTPGQAAVFFRGDHCLGGGRILRTSAPEKEPMANLAGRTAEDIGGNPP